MAHLWTFVTKKTKTLLTPKNKNIFDEKNE